MSVKAIVYQRDHINTDEIIPARYLTSDKEADLALHAMEDLDMDFVNKVNPGDIVVAGTDLAQDREHAVWALRGAGIKAVIADSFARIFYRNCLNNGFVAIECPGAAVKINDTDELELDFEKGVILNKTQKTEIKFNPFPPFAKAMLDAGGLLNYIQNNK